MHSMNTTATPATRPYTVAFTGGPLDGIQADDVVSHTARTCVTRSYTSRFMDGVGRRVVEVVREHIILDLVYDDGETETVSLHNGATFEVQS